MKNLLIIVSAVLVLLAGVPLGSINAQVLDFGDAPEGALAYPSSGIGGAFPTCMTIGPAGWIQHTNFGAWFGPATMVDFEPDGNAGFCPQCFPPYDQDECFADPDAGLIIPPAYTIDPTPAVVPCVPGVEGPLGYTCQTAVWGVNVDIDIHNWMPNHPPYLPAYINVLMDWNQDGDWNDVTTCYTQGDAPEHVLVDWLVPPQYDGPLSWLLPPNFLIGPNPGYVWTRFTISEYPVGFGWNGEGYFEDGETEDYLLLVEEGEYTIYPVVETECPVVETECPVIETHCPVEPTYCPVVETQCPEQGPTICPEIATECPEIFTECPHEFTFCPEYFTFCPEDPTWCPIWPTECPVDPTFCPVGPTMCEFTICDVIPTWCPEEPTICPVIDTACPEIPTVCPIYPDYTVCPEIATQCPATVTECELIPTECPEDPTYCTTADADGDGINDCLDNCIDTPNGPAGGTCIAGKNGDFCMSDSECDTLSTPGVCSMVQEDSYPPCGNNCGDACECEGDFDSDRDVKDGDIPAFKGSMGRGPLYRPCSICTTGSGIPPNNFCQTDTDCGVGGVCEANPTDPCYGDFDCDGDVKDGDIAVFKADMGRGPLYRICPLCSGVVCGY